MLRLVACASMSHMQVVIGVDGCKGGWIFVRLENGAFASAARYEHFADGVGASDDAARIGVDMPIGYPSPPALERAADAAARTMVRPLASSVFPALHPDVLAAPDKATAHDISHELTGRRANPLSLALVPKILQVQAVATQDERVYEVHPEVSFRKLAGHPLASKKSWNGHTQRRALLVAAGIVIPKDLGRGGTAAADDILDAAVAAWSAGRIAEGVATPLPNPPERDANNRKVAIWY